MYGYDASLNIKNSFPVFSTHIEANYIARKEDVYSLYSLTDEDKNAIITLSKDPRIGKCATHLYEVCKSKCEQAHCVTV